MTIQIKELLSRLHQRYIISSMTYSVIFMKSCYRLTTIIYDIQSSNIQPAHHFNNLETMYHVDYIPVRSNHYPLFEI